MEANFREEDVAVETGLRTGALGSPNLGGSAMRPLGPNKTFSLQIDYHWDLGRLAQPVLGPVWQLVLSWEGTRFSDWI